MNMGIYQKDVKALGDILTLPINFMDIMLGILFSMPYPIKKVNIFIHTKQKNCLFILEKKILTECSIIGRSLVIHNYIDDYGKQGRFVEKDDFQLYREMTYENNRRFSYCIIH